MKKKLHIIAQAKGGVGKSLLAYLFALAKQKDENCLFVDVDSSTKTSSRQLHFLGENRNEMLSLLDEKEALVRDQFFVYLESLTTNPFSEFYFDFGAPESDQLPALLDLDLPFKEFCDELNLEVQFHIVIAGGGAYTASMAYLQKMLKAVKSEFEITVWQSITSFHNQSDLTAELKSNCKKLSLKFRSYGDFEPSSYLGNQILDGVRRSNNLLEYATGAKIKLKRELELNFSEELDALKN